MRQKRGGHKHNQECDDVYIQPFHFARRYKNKNIELQ